MTIANCLLFSTKLHKRQNVMRFKNLNVKLFILFLSIKVAIKDLLELNMNMNSENMSYADRADKYKAFFSNLNDQI